MDKVTSSYLGSDVLSNRVPSVPLRGYIVKQENDQIWVQDGGGTWLVNTKDVTGRAKWDGRDSRFKGEPVCLYIKQGAEIFEIRKLVIEIDNTPITFGQDSSAAPVKGMDVMMALESGWRRHLGFKPGQSQEACPSQKVPGVTWCCWLEGETNWHCTGDDSGWVEE